MGRSQPWWPNNSNKSIRSTMSFILLPDLSSYMPIVLHGWRKRWVIVFMLLSQTPLWHKGIWTRTARKLSNGYGGVWRIPPSFDGHVRSPLPRFTALNPKERERIQRYFYEWAKLALRVLRPGSHIFLASNAFLSQIVFTAIANAGLEFLR